MIATASLRIFQPLDALPAAERDRWSRFIDSGEHLKPYRIVYRHRWTHGRLGVITTDADRADVRVVAGEWYVCPWRMRLRLLASLLSLRQSVPPEVADAFVPEAEARKAARELSRIRRRDPAAVPTMLQSSWHVPVRWFVLFDGEERRIAERSRGGYRLWYWTLATKARARAERALDVLRENELEVVAGLVEDMVTWLGVFDPRAAVELDYGRVADLFSPVDLEEDHSARDLQASLEALAEDEAERAAELYQGVASRWAEAKTRESLN